MLLLFTWQLMRWNNHLLKVWLLLIKRAQGLRTKMFYYPRDFQIKILLEWKLIKTKHQKVGRKLIKIDQIDLLTYKVILQFKDIKLKLKRVIDNNNSKNSRLNLEIFKKLIKVILKQFVKQKKRHKEGEIRFIN